VSTSGFGTHRGSFGLGCGGVRIEGAAKLGDAAFALGADDPEGRPRTDQAACDPKPVHFSFLIGWRGLGESFSAQDGDITAVVVARRVLVEAGKGGLIVNQLEIGMLL
jgi:hypothetical protein